MAINPAEITTIRTGELTPATPTLSSIIAHELSEELFNCTIQDLVDLLNLNVGTLQYEVKTLYVDQEYIDTNFDATGLGRLLCDGFAIINGNNGTPPASGMFELSYKKEVYEIGSYGGYKDATLVEHFHSVNLQQLNSNSDAGSGKLATGGQSAEGIIPNINTATVGEVGTDKNMPPYYVCLKIMKL
jgi:hypothetical protein